MRLQYFKTTLLPFYVACLKTMFLVWLGSPLLRMFVHFVSLIDYICLKLVMISGRYLILRDLFMIESTLCRMFNMRLCEKLDEKLARLEWAYFVVVSKIVSVLLLKMHSLIKVLVLKHSFHRFYMSICLKFINSSRI